jgi:hypothetical protein
MDVQSLIETEKRLLNLESNMNLQELGALFSHNFFEFGSSGKIWSRAEVLKSLSNSKSRPKKAFDFRGHILSENEVVLVTYKTKEPTENGDRIVLPSSFWKLGDSGWQVFFHQGTQAEGL